MNYLIYVSISALLYGLYDFFKKASTKKGTNIYEILFFYTSIAFLLSIFFIKEALNIEFKYIVFLFLKATIISISWAITMKAMKKLDLGIVTPFSILGIVFTTIFAYLFFDQAIGITQLVGMIIITIGLILLGRLQKKEESKNDYRYLALLVVASILSSLAGMIDKACLINISNKAVEFWFFFFLSIIYLIITLIKNKKINFASLKTNYWIIFIGISIFLTDYFYYVAISDARASLSIVSIVRKISVFIGVILSCIFLKEKDFLRKVLISSFIFCGLGVILFL